MATKIEWCAGVPFFLKRLSDGTRRLYGREHNALPWQVSE